nr:hypothetical protein [Polymorphobacter sp.]
MKANVKTPQRRQPATRNIGAGLSYMHADLDVKVTKPSFTGNVKWKNDNFLAYVLLKF